MQRATTGMANWELYWAARANNRSAVGRLLGTADPSFLQSLPLRAACRAGSVCAVQLLLHDGRADANARHGEALLYALCHGQLLITSALLKWPGIIVPHTLPTYVWKGLVRHADVLRFVLRDGRVATPAPITLQYAVLANNVASVRELVSAGVALTPFALAAAISRNSLDVVAALLCHPHPPVADDDVTAAFWTAARKNWIHMVRLLLADGRVKPGAARNRADKFAVCSDIDVIKAIVASTELRTAPAVAHALYRGDSELIRQLVPATVQDNTYYILEVLMNCSTLRPTADFRYVCEWLSIHKSTFDEFCDDLIYHGNFDMCRFILTKPGVCGRKRVPVHSPRKMQRLLRASSSAWLAIV